MSGFRSRRIARGWRDGFLPALPRADVTLGDQRSRITLAIVIAVAGGAMLGVLSVAINPVAGVMLLVGLLGAVILISDPRAGLWAVVGIVTLLPFAVIPIRIGVTLTLFEIAVLGVIGVWILGLMLRHDERLVASTPALWVALLLAITLFALLLGIGRGYTTATFHDYGKFVLAISLFFVVWNVVRNLDDARRMVLALIAGTAAASALGLALYAAGAGVSERVLSRLIPFGYPDTRIVRFIEDDPGRPMRMVSTSVDPNSFGGLVAVVLVLACAQAVCRYPLFPCWLMLGSAGIMSIALLLTYSRGAWVGAAVGVAVLALLRYRRLIVPGALIALGMIVFGFGAAFLERMWLGLTLQDPATRLRLAEYQNAIAIIREYPVFGVGFGDAPSIELQAGVSSIYLAIAQRTGLVGLTVFTIAVGTVLIAGLRSWRRSGDGAQSDLTLALIAALVAALTIGVFDHYFFNITFPHMAALLWIISGLILALALPAGGRSLVHNWRSSCANHATDMYAGQDRRDWR